MAESLKKLLAGRHFLSLVMNIDHSLVKVLIKRKDKLNALPGFFIVKRGFGVKKDFQ